MNADFADKKRKSVFLCVNQRPNLISDNVYYNFYNRSHMPKEVSYG